MRFWICALLAVGMAGCGSSSSQQAQENFPSPEETLTSFLDAVRRGEDKEAAKLLTPLARQKTAEAEMDFAPRASDTAKFEILDVKKIADDGVHIETKWTDAGASSQPQEDEIVWMLRKEEEGWRIAGMGAKPFKDRPRVYLNFEDPDDVQRKYALIEEEIERRSQAELQATLPTTADGPIRK